MELEHGDHEERSGRMPFQSPHQTMTARHCTVFQYKPSTSCALYLRITDAIGVGWEAG